MSIASSVLASFLTAEHVNGVLDVCGYRGVAVRLGGGRLLAPGCAVALQFGDEVTVDDGGELRLRIRCSLRINGAADHAVRATYWQIHQSLQRPSGPDRLGLALEADLILADGIAIADVLAYGGAAYRHLRLLIADGRDTLERDLRIDRLARDDAAGPALHIEARLFGDLISGRSGLVLSSRSATSEQHRRITSAACDWLMDEALPDLARAVRAIIQNRSGSSRRLQAACAMAPPLSENPAPLAAPGGNIDISPILPNLELAR
jgi:hypothetical protein